MGNIIDGFCLVSPDVDVDAGRLTPETPVSLARHQGMAFEGEYFIQGSPFDGAHVFGLIEGRVFATGLCLKKVLQPGEGGEIWVTEGIMIPRCEPVGTTIGLGSTRESD